MRLHLDNNRDSSPGCSATAPRIKETTQGLDYLRNRAITAGEAIDRFRIGFANKTLGRKLPTKQSKAGREIRTRLQQVGFLGIRAMNASTVA